MATVTLAESAKLSEDKLIQGVVENIITINRFYELLAFEGIDGNALAYNRENVLGGVASMGVGATISAAQKAPATFTQVTSSLTTILGDAEVNGLIQATRSSKNNQRAVQVSSKAKNLGRNYQTQLLSGDGTSDDFVGLLNLVDPSKAIVATTGGVPTNGGPLSFELLDELLALVTDKDGQVDYMQMNVRTINSYFALLRALGGAAIDHTVQLPSGTTVPGYRGVPIFRNDYMPLDQVTGSLTTGTTVLAGTLDDGSQKVGIAGLTASQSAGIVVENVGISETKDETITRVKWYAGLALFNLNGLAALTGVED